MEFKNTFCSSPWIHMRITNQGYYNFCRWETHKVDTTRDNIINVHPIEYFQRNMTAVRKKILKGEYLDECKPCYDMEKFKKISGRQKQLLKTGIVLDNFTKTLQASPYYSEFEKTANDNAETILPVDWQVDLGNYCNSACTFCSPESSSMLANEYLKINLLDEKIPTSWCNDTKLVDKLIDTFIQTPNLKYIHFIGGETIITPAFKQILTALCEHNLTHVTLGLTTNLTVWNDEINALLSNFENINLGMSIESLNTDNDYARYPSKIESVRLIMDKWVELGNSNKWLMQIRMTPTWITVNSLSTIFEYAFNNNIAVESCNFLHEPTYMRMTLLPLHLREEAIDNLTNWINTHQTHISETVSINIRNPNIAKQEILNDAMSYLNYLNNAPYEPELVPALISFLAKIETSRNISILDYKPEYEEFLRTSGYKFN